MSEPNVAELADETRNDASNLSEDLYDIKQSVETYGCLDEAYTGTKASQDKIFKAEQLEAEAARLHAAGNHAEARAMEEQAKEERERTQLLINKVGEAATEFIGRADSIRGRSETAARHIH